MDKIKITKEMLKDTGSRVLVLGLTTDKILNYYGWGDKNKPLKVVVSKGYIEDWCVYVESMIDYQDYDTVRDSGNKLTKEEVKILIDCTDEVWGRYRE